MPIKKEITYTINEHGCWICTSHALNSNGYPQYTRNKKSIHIYAVMYGKPLQPGKVIRHTCDNKACINPAHLIEGTQVENMKDYFERNPSVSRKILSRDDVELIRAIGKSKSIKELSELFKVSEILISKILNKTKWK